MAVKVEMPKLSDTMDEGVLHQWNVEEGDEVESGDVIAEVETDKATMEVEVFDSGTILKIMAEEGEGIPLGDIIAVIGEEGEDISDIVGGSSEPDEGEDEEQEADKEEDTSDQDEEQEQVDDKEEETADGKGETEESAGSSESSTNQESSDDGRMLASPLARNMAEDEGIDLSKVDGSGPNGRIIKRDIESYEPSSADEMVSSHEDTEHDVSQMRKTIAKRLSESKYNSPHFYETIDIDAEALVQARKELNDSIDDKISFGNIIAKASAMALRKHPQVNSSWQGDHILEHGDVSVAFAVAVEAGLVTPVIENTDQKGLLQIANESKDLIEQAHNSDLDLDQMEGSTFTISELGMFGIDEFTAIINPPNA